MEDNNKGPILMLCLSVLLSVFIYGYTVGKYNIFPHSLIEKASKGYEWCLERAGLRKAWYYSTDKYLNRPEVPNLIQDEQGLNLITHVAANNAIAAEIRNLKNEIVHSWTIDWFDIWPNATHLAASDKPKSRPGTHIHGAIVTEAGDLIFNFERLGLVKLDRKSNVIWRLPVRTHHTVFQADNGNLWVCGFDDSRNLSNTYPSLRSALDEMIMEVDLDGNILRKIHMVDVLEQNNLRGVLYLHSPVSSKGVVSVSGDILHLNDVEIFPDHMTEGLFQHGDIMVSLRNVSTILVLDPKTLKVKFRSTGVVNLQHDPDFVDGNTITVFDNNPQYYEGRKLRSRIVEISAPSGKSRVIFQGNEKHPFFSNIMGKHQWLPDGNLLITETQMGRAFEVDPQGDLVWEFRNRVGAGEVAVVEEVQRLTPEVAKAFMQ